MDTKELDKKIQNLSGIETRIAELNLLRDELRGEIFKSLEENNVEQYKNDQATISYVERKTVKILDEEKLLDSITRQKIVKFYTDVPQHLELNTKALTEAVRKGTFTHELIEVTESKGLAITLKKKQHEELE